MMFAIILTLVTMVSTSLMFSHGFGLSTNTSPPQKVPQFLRKLYDTGRWTNSKHILGCKKTNRVKALTARSTIKRDNYLSLQFQVPIFSHHGVLQSAKLILLTKPGPSCNVTVQLNGVFITQPLTASTAFDDLIINIDSKLISPDSKVQVIISSRSHISDTISLHEKPLLLLLLKNDQIKTNSAQEARQDFLQSLGSSITVTEHSTETTVAEEHKLNKRSVSHHARSHCRRHDFLIDFQSIGYSSILAPTVYNAYQCSGKCHLSDANTPMTNHAYIQNILYHSGESTIKAECVPGETSPLHILSLEEGEIVITLYEDMIVKSCSCR